MATIELSSTLDLKAAGPLKADIQSHAGGELELDASRVERLGGLCLQVIVAAAATWRAANQNFRLINVGEAFRKDARLLGATGLLPGLE
ncbi:MAG: STAS domain-containing protein [Hyphomonadaceae bacterium]